MSYTEGTYKPWLTWLGSSQWSGSSQRQRNSCWISERKTL